jgi:formylglycine-generating enzyme required for sulfatase activity
MPRSSQSSFPWKFASAACAAALVAAACRGGADTVAEGTAAADTTTDSAIDSAADARLALVRVDDTPLATEVVSVPGTAVSFAMVRVPSGFLRGERVESFAVATLEVTWDDYLAMLLESEGPPPSKSGEPIDGFARPTKPYIATDRGYGQGKRPIISISAKGAESFAHWLALRTGRPFRLPTEREWEWAARAGSTGRWTCGDDPAALDALAWYDANANQSSQLVGTKAPNAWGLFDVHGNVAEWCRVEQPDGTKYGAHALAGGSFFDLAEGLEFGVREFRDTDWNMSDPQIPKSVWWLANAAWPGMRVVMDVE